MKLTEAQIRVLAWIAAREPVGLFTPEGGSNAMRKRMVKAGLIETIPGPAFSFVRFQLTEAGRAALRETE